MEPVENGFLDKSSQTANQADKRSSGTHEHQSGTPLEWCSWAFDEAGLREGRKNLIFSRGELLRSSGRSLDPCFLGFQSTGFKMARQRGSENKGD